MPGLVPPVTDERTCLLSYLAQQRDGIRYATHGLTDAQAMARPSVSELSLGGLVKHAALVEQAWVGFIQEGDSSVFLPEYDWADGFRLVDGETLADVVSFSADVARTHGEDRHRPARPRCPAACAPAPACPGSPPAWSGRRAGSCSTSSKRPPATPATPTSSASRWTAPRAGRSWRRPRDGPRTQARGIVPPRRG